jgi:predicted HAD superfamily Cof-like phosphohydrolase
MSADQIELWHKRARPSPTAADFNVQLGCHFEEIEEMMRAIKADDEELWEDVRLQVLSVSRLLKANLMKATITNRKEFLDSLADQVVTGIGVGHCAGMKTAEAIAAVNRSNYSKFDKNGYPIFNEQGKVMKGPDYAPPDLEGLY